MKDNRGYTLVELILSMAITVFLVTIVISFLTVDSKSCRYVNNEVSLQMESQTVMNQIYDNVIEADWVSMSDVDSSVKALIIYHPSDITAMFLNTATKQMFLVEGMTSADIADLSDVSYSIEDNLMAESVAGISVSPTDADSLLVDKQITIHLDFANSTGTYHADQNIRFRNKLVKP